MVSNPKFRWQESDPKTGIDIMPFIQTGEDTTESACSSKGGVYIAYKHWSGGRCYTYTVLTHLCFIIGFTEHIDSASYSWDYRSGCYSDGEIGVYETAKVGEEYKFEYIPIEVREDDSVFSSLGNVGSEVGQVASSGLSFFTILANICFILALVSLLAFGGLFFKAWNDAQAGSRMRHQEQVDDE
jgi:hypothetical protein